jgi:hypothetical protein
VSWRKPIPTKFVRAADDDYCILVTHDDLQMHEAVSTGRFRPFEIQGIDLVVNGHVHRQLGEQVVGMTTWCNPGNISRVTRSDAVRAFAPSVLRMTLTGGDWERSLVVVPHRPFEEVFHDGVTVEDSGFERSEFVQGLAELQIRKTDSGAGLRQFLDLNLPHFDDDIRTEIESLAAEVLKDEPSIAGDIK